MPPLFAAQPTEVFPQNPGLSKLFIGDVDDFTTIQTPTAGVISTAHVAPAGQGFYELPLVLGKEGKFVNDSVGEYPSQKTKSGGDFSFVGLSIEQVENIEKLKGKKLIAILQNGNCDSPTKWQVGCDCRPAVLSEWKFDSDTNILMFKIEAYCPLRKYTAATIPMAS